MKILVIAQQKNNQLASVSTELISAGKALGGELFTAMLAEEAKAMADELASCGGGKVLAVSNRAVLHFNDEIYAKVISVLIAKYSPDLILGAATVYGKALVSRLAATHGGQMASDVTGLVMDGDKVIATRPAFGGSVIAQLKANSSSPFFVTVRPKIFAESKDGAGEVIAEEVSGDCFESRMTVRESTVESSGSENLAEADVIVAAGRGIKSADGVPLVKELAASLKGAFGASRAIVDAGWVPYANQVGQTGRTVNPKLYVAVGISGAIQHLVGMQTSQTIVAINKDKDAPIFNVASYGIVGDLFEILPAMTKKFEAEL
ncbi:MAG: electron transfer flavoprotein subunit alpha/FixB family protein [candidate division Zixibacteria bacterium]